MVGISKLLDDTILERATAALKGWGKQVWSQGSSRLFIAVKMHGITKMSIAK